VNKLRFELPRGVYTSADGNDHSLKTTEEGYVFPTGTTLKIWKSDRGFETQDISDMTFVWFEPGNEYYASEVLLEKMGEPV